MKELLDKEKVLDQYLRIREGYAGKTTAEFLQFILGAVEAITLIDNKNTEEENILLINSLAKSMLNNYKGN